MHTSSRVHLRSTAVLLVLALAAGACSQAPSSPTAPSSVLSRGAAPQTGPPVAGDTLPSPTALGANRFMAFGDSITYGTTSSFDGAFLFDAGATTSYPAQLQSELRASFPTQNVSVENRGVPGDEAIRAVSSGRFAQAMATFRPQGLILLEGINDLNNGESVNSVVTALGQMIDIARLYNTTVLVSTMFQTCESTDPNTGRVRLNATNLIVPFNSAIRGMAAGRQNVYVVDIYGVMGNNCGPDGGFGLLGGDGLHPSVNGYSVMASTYASALRLRFPVAGSFQ
ncbi:MAG: SGNH/GDSL hydrolase family protein [Acidobacteriota bacterium]